MERMFVALRFGDSKFSGGYNGLELKNCTEALELIPKLSDERGRGICMNNMGNCLSDLHESHRKKPESATETSELELAALIMPIYPKLLPAMLMKQVTMHSSSLTSRDVSLQFNANAMDPDVYFQLAVIKAELMDKNSILAFCPVSQVSNSKTRFGRLYRRPTKTWCSAWMSAARSVLRLAMSSMRHS